MSENKRNVDRDVELAKPSQGNAHPTGTSTLEANRQQYAEHESRQAKGVAGRKKGQQD